MKLKNETSHTIKVPSLGLVVEPDETVEVEDGYCLPMRSQNKTRVPPIIERLAPGLVPVTAKDKKAFEVPQPWKPPVVVPTAGELVSKGTSPGVAEILAAKAQEKAEAVKEEEKPKPKRRVKVSAKKTAKTEDGD